MTTSRIKEKISALVSSQLPDFVQSDFPTFVAFIEAYYKFLEQDQSASELIQNARSYNDIDRTTDSFVEYFLNTYAKNIPPNLLSDSKFLIKKIKDLYESKGSELSFKLLFRILFDTDIEIKVPYNNVLRASGGNWQQNFSIRVETTTGNRNVLLNRSITHSVNGVIYQTPIVRTKNLTSTLTELFLDSRSLSPTYSIDDLIQVFEGSTLVFSGTISPTTTQFRIDQPGLEFKVGQIFNIAAGGIDTLIKVTKVSSVGGLLDFKIVSYGYGYSGVGDTNTVTIILDKNNKVSSRENFFNSKVSGFGSSGSILKSDLLNPDRYFDTVEGNYTDDLFYTITEVAATFNNDSFDPLPDFESGIQVSPNLAVVVFTLGALAVYPGSYFDDQSFLSEFEVRLQDDQLYQPFAYQTNTEVDIGIFVDIIKKLLNPAGQSLFNNRLIRRDLDLSSSLSLETTRKIFVNLHDSAKYFDVFSREIFSFKDNAAIFDSDEFYNLSKPLEDDVEITFNQVFDLEKNLSDNALIDVDVASNIFKQELDNQIVDDGVFNLDITIPQEDFVQIVEIASAEFQTEVFNDVNVVDNFNIGLLFVRNFEEDRSKDYFFEEYTDLGNYVEQTGVVFFDSDFASIEKNLFDTTTTSDQITEIGVFIQDYFEEEYTSLAELPYVYTNTDIITNP